MQRLKVLGLALVAVFAMSAVASSSALAASTNNPQWEVNKVLLTEGNTQAVTAKANGNQLLVVKGLLNFTITCKKLELSAGAKLIGSNKPNAGTSEENIIYKECKIEGKPNCEVFSEEGGVKKANGTIETVPLKSTLVFTTEKAAIAELSEEGGVSTGSVLFAPKTGESFVTIVLKGAECPVQQATTVTGTVVARELGHPEVNAVTHEIEGVETGTYWKNNAGKSEKFEAKRLKAFGVESGYKGDGVIEAGGLSWRIFN
jgi:hypothetical protein